MASAMEECLAGRAKVAAGDPALARLQRGSGYIVRAAIRAHFPPADSGPLDRTTIRAATWLLRRRNAWPAGRRVQQVTPHLPGSSGAKALCKGFLVRAAIRAPWGVERFGPIGPRDDSGSWFARRGAGHIGSPGVEQVHRLARRKALCKGFLVRAGIRAPGCADRFGPIGPRADSGSWFARRGVGHIGSRGVELVHRLARRFGLPGPCEVERSLDSPTSLALQGAGLLPVRSNQRMQWTPTFVTVLALSRGSSAVDAS